MGGTAGKLTGHAFQKKYQVPVYGANPDAGQVYWSQQRNPNATESFNAARPDQDIYLGTGTPNLFKPYDQYMPAEFNNSAPIYNPNSILDAYSKHLPEFMEAARPLYQYQIAPEVQTGVETKYKFNPISLFDPLAIVHSLPGFSSIKGAPTTGSIIHKG